MLQTKLTNLQVQSQNTYGVVDAEGNSDGLLKYQLWQVIAYINENLSEDLSLETIAQQINISQFYFCHLFKRSMGISPYQYVLQQRIARAKQLLIQDQLSLSEIALEVGFANQSHFSRQFKQLVGMSPKRFAIRERGASFTQAGTAIFPSH